MGRGTSRRRSVSCSPAAAPSRCAVTDADIGMTPEQIGKLFQEFSQASFSTAVNMKVPALVS
jgi:hypothetical protein